MRNSSKIQFRVVVSVADLDYCNTEKYCLEVKKGDKKTVIKSLELKTELDNVNRRFKMIPRFTVENAQGRQFKACLYFYDADKNILRDNAGAVQSWCTEFTPYSNSAAYYTGNLLSVYVPYAEINMPYGRHDMKYFLALWENGVQIATGTWNTITMTR